MSTEEAPEAVGTQAPPEEGLLNVDQALRHMRETGVTSYPAPGEEGDSDQWFFFGSASVITKRLQQRLAREPSLTLRVCAFSSSRKKWYLVAPPYKAVPSITKLQSVPESPGPGPEAVLSKAGPGWAEGIARAEQEAKENLQRQADMFAMDGLGEAVEGAGEAELEDCMVCMDEVQLADMAVVDCPEGHRLCVECITEHVRIFLTDSLLPKCPGWKCSHPLNAALIASLLGRGDPLVARERELRGKGAIASDPRYVACPQPNCPKYVYVRDLKKKQLCVCPRKKCGFKFCSLCKERYHYKLACGELKPVSLAYIDWMEKGRAQYLGYHKQQSKKIKADLANAKKVFKNFGADEKWKAAHCKMCPNCERVVYKVDGCDSMTCGRDASDKGGGNAQDGCGKRFNWREAKPYKSQNKGFHMPSIMANTDLQRVQTCEHFLADGKTRVPCQLCKADIIGPRFSCIHCPTGLELCMDCSMKDEMYYVGDHQPDHSFKLWLENSTLEANKEKAKGHSPEARC